MSVDKIILFIHLMPFKGKVIDPEKWRLFFTHLKEVLNHYGLADEGNTAEFIRYHFNRPEVAIGAALNALAAAREAAGIERGLSIPLHLILDYPRPDQPGPEILTAGPEGDFLRHEQPYITQSLRREWERLGQGEGPAGIEFEPAGGGLFLLRISDPASLTPVPLFPSRPLPLQGKAGPCFYCSSHDHHPGQCPSRYLDMAHRGLAQAGYLSIAEIDQIHATLFSEPGRTATLIGSGIDQARLRKEPELQVACAFFDLGLVYQPRFLHNLVFSIDPQWKGAFSPDRKNMDCQPFNLALDCLRGGNYQKCGELLRDLLAQPQKARHFAANAALALLAIETGTARDALPYLEQARELALSEKEDIYVHLLLSRCHFINKDIWKAANELGNIRGMGRNHQAVRYLAMRLAARQGIDAGFLDEISRLAASDRETFIRALIDPELVPAMGLVDEALNSILIDKKKKALDATAMAEKDLEELALWCEEGEAELVENRHIGETIRKNLAGESYFGLIDAEERASVLMMGCQRARQKKVEELRRLWSRADHLCRKADKAWEEFRYPGLFRGFAESLARTKATVRKIGEKISIVIDGAAYRRLRQEMELIEPTLKLIRQDLEKIRLLGSLIDLGRAFAVNLLLCEAALIALALAGIPLFTRIGQGGGTIISLLATPSFQYRALSIGGFIIAPILALSITLARARNR